MGIMVATGNNSTLFGSLDLFWKSIEEVIQERLEGATDKDEDGGERGDEEEKSVFQCLPLLRRPNGVSLRWLGVEV